MSYSIAVNGSTILQGDFFGTALVILLILALLSFIANLVWKRIKETDTMKYEFITIIAHKFRTPLTTVKWLLENMIGDETDPHRRENFVDMKASNEKLIALTGTLIELTNLDSETRSSYQLEKVSFCEFAKQVSDSHKDMYHEKNIFFTLQCVDPNVFVEVDKARMEFVLQTLFENACNYTPPGRNVDVFVGAKGGKAMMAVTDHGIGIDKADLPKLFSKFYRASNAKEIDTEGFGVGLFLAQSIVRHHHGRIVAYSAGKGQGSTFTLVLPKVRP